MKTVLIVEDEEVVRNCMGRAFKSKGLNVISAATGEEAIKLYSENKPGFIILDLHLPGIDGIEVLKKIRGIDKEAKAYFITGDQGGISNGEKESFDVLDCIIKPIDVEQLFELAERFLTE